MQIKILQWNVWYKEKIDKVLDVIKPLNADIVCLQELTQGYIGQEQENSWEYIGHELGYNFHYQEIPIFTETQHWLQANAIFSKYPIIVKKNAWLHKPTAHDDRQDQYRGYLEVELDINGKDLTIATTHMSFRVDPSQDKELEILMELVREDPKRYILTGDINATPESRRIAEITKILDNTGPAFDQNTWTTKPFDFETFKASTLDWRYDYIFNSRDLKVTDAQIIKTDVSDHLPLLATIEL